MTEKNRRRSAKGGGKTYTGHDAFKKLAKDAADSTPTSDERLTDVVASGPSGIELDRSPMIIVASAQDFDPRLIDAKPAIEEGDGDDEEVPIRELVERRKVKLDALARSPEMEALVEDFHARIFERRQAPLEDVATHLSPDPEALAMILCLINYPLVRWVLRVPPQGVRIHLLPAGCISFEHAKRALPEYLVRNLNPASPTLARELVRHGLFLIDTGGDEAPMDQHDKSDNRFGSRTSSFDREDVLIGQILGAYLTELDVLTVPEMVALNAQDLTGATMGQDWMRRFFEDHPNTGRTITAIGHGWNGLNRKGVLNGPQARQLNFLAHRASRAAIRRDFARWERQLQPYQQPLRDANRLVATLFTERPDPERKAEIHRGIRAALDTVPKGLPDVFDRYDAVGRKVFLTPRMHVGIPELLRGGNRVSPVLADDLLFREPLAAFGVGPDSPPTKGEEVWRHWVEEALIEGENEWKLAARDVERYGLQHTEFDGLVYDRTDDPVHPAENGGKAVHRDLSVVWGFSDSSRFASFVRFYTRNGWKGHGGVKMPRPNVIIQFRRTWVDPTDDAPFEGGEAWKFRAVRNGESVFYASTFHGGKQKPSLRLDTAGALLRFMDALKHGAVLPDDQLTFADEFMAAKNLQYVARDGSTRFATPFVPSFLTGTGCCSYKNPFVPWFSFDSTKVVAHICWALGRGHDNLDALLRDETIRRDPRAWFLYLARRYREKLARAKP